MIEPTAKPRMPPEGVFHYVAADLGFKLCSDPDRYSSGVMHMKIAGMIAEVKIDGKVVGNIAACIGGGIEVGINGRTWFLSFQDIWNAAEVADEQYEYHEYLKKSEEQHEERKRESWRIVNHEKPADDKS